MIYINYFDNLINYFDNLINYFDDLYYKLINN